MSFTYTRTWDTAYEASPADSDYLVECPEKIRQIKVDTRESLQYPRWDMDCDFVTVTSPLLQNYAETVRTDNIQTTYTVALTYGNVFNLTIKADTTLVFETTGLVTGRLYSFLLLITQDDTGDWELTFPAEGKWDVEPSLLTTKNTTTIVEAYTVNAGAVWYLRLVGTGYA